MKRSRFSGADRICCGSAEDGTSGTHRDQRISSTRCLVQSCGCTVRSVGWCVPVLTLIHIVPGLLFRGPLQFSSTIRANYLRWHRLSGRIFVVCGVVIGTSALAMSFRVPAIGVYSRCAKRFGISGFSDGPELLASDSHWPPHIRAPLSGISCYL